MKRYFVSYNDFIANYNKILSNKDNYDFDDKKRLTELYYNTKKDAYSLVQPPLYKRGNSWAEHAVSMPRKSKLVMEIYKNELDCFSKNKITTLQLVDNYYYEEQPREFYFLKNPYMYTESISDIQELNLYRYFYYELKEKYPQLYGLEKINDQEIQITAINGNKPNEINEFGLKIDKDYPEEVENGVIYLKQNENKNYEIKDIPHKGLRRVRKMFRR